MDTFTPEPVFESAAPFVVVHAVSLAEGTPHFSPQAFLAISPTVRTSGFLRAVPAEELRTLVALLAFHSPNGDVWATADQVASVLDVSAARARDRLSRLSRVSWQEQYIATETTAPSGLVVYRPAVHLTVQRHLHAPDLPASAPVQAAGGKAIIAYSRERYGNPRSEVEAAMAKDMGWEEPEADETPEGAERVGIYRKLRAMGCAPAEIESLCARFDISLIRRQIDWLPFRHAINPRSYLLAAIENDYAAPRGAPESTRTDTSTENKIPSDES
jgi:hypothetical protein